MYQIGNLVSRLAQPDVHRVRVAEKIVQVPEDLLICARQENAEHVRFAVVAKRMQREAGVAVSTADEAVDLAVGIAAHVLQRAASRGLFIKPVDGHDGKELVDRPAVRQ